jgi:hypothetical protein
VRPLVAVRRAAAFDPRFLERSPLFWPVARAARSLGPCDDFPNVDDLVRVFEGRPPIRFVEATPARRRRAAVDAQTLYDGRVTLEAVVPTRPRCWHDFMNALVWGTFPKAKRALHARQHRAIAERLAPGATTLPPRSPELDALALLDEGGIAVLCTDPERARRRLRAREPGALEAEVASGAAVAVIFGHAIYESLALGVAPAVAAAIVLPRDASEPDAVLDADAGLAGCFEDPAALRSPRELTRVDVSHATPRDMSPRAEKPAAEP